MQTGNETESGKQLTEPTENNMPNDIKAKLQSLKSLKGEMKDWKKDDLRKKKGVKQPEMSEQDTQKHQEAQGPQMEKEQDSQSQSILAKLIAKLVK